MSDRVCALPPPCRSIRCAGSTAISVVATATELSTRRQKSSCITRSKPRDRTEGASVWAGLGRECQQRVWVARVVHPTFSKVVEFAATRFTYGIDECRQPIGLPLTTSLRRAAELD